MTKYYSFNGNAIDVIDNSDVGKGGQGSIFKIQADTTRIAKLYHVHSLPDDDTSEKLIWMYQNPPLDPCANQQHRSFAWPDDLLYKKTTGIKKQLIGYVMPYIHPALLLLEVLNPTYCSMKLPGFTWKYLINTARNLSIDISALHDKGYIIGDLNQRNVIVKDNSLVTILDTDSFQVAHPKYSNPLLCPVGVDDYLAPELIGKQLKTTIRQPQADFFSLAILIFQLLMKGNHPFRGKYLLAGDPPQTAEAISKGWYAYGKTSSDYMPAPHSPKLEILPEKVQGLFQSCFVDGYLDEKKRPDPKTWFLTLSEAINNLKDCSQDRRHVYSNHLSACPWCPSKPPIIIAPNSVSNNQAQNTPISRWKLITTTVDFGTIPPDIKRKRRIKIENLGSTNLSVTLVIPPNSPWLSCQQSSVFIPPKQQGTLTLSLSTSNLGGAANSKSFTSSISIQGGNVSQTIPVSFEVGIPILSISPKELRYPPLGPGQTSLQIITISNTGIGNLQGTIISLDPWITLTTATFLSTKKAPASIGVMVKIPNSRTNSQNTQMVGSVKVVTSNSTQTINVIVPLLLPALSVNTNFIAFPSAIKGEQPEKSIDITNSGNSNLSGVISTSAPWLQLSTTNINLLPGQTSQVTLKVLTDQLSRAGKNATEIFIATNGGDKRIPIEITMLEPQISLSSPEISFGNAGEKETIEKRIAVNNPGMAPLIVKVSSNEAWLTVRDTEFIVPPKQSKDLIASASTQNLPGNINGKPYMALLFLETNIGLIQIRSSIQVYLPMLAVKQTSLGLYTQSMGDPISTILDLENKGTVDVTGKIEGKADWLKVNPGSFTLSPQSPARMNVRVETKGLKSAPEGARNNTEIKISSNAGEIVIPVTVTISSPNLSIKTSEFNLGSFEINAVKTIEIEYTNTGTGYLEGTVHSTTPWIKIKNPVIKCSSREVGKILVTIDGTYATGISNNKFKASIQFKTNGGNQPVSLKGQIKSPHMIVKVPEIISLENSDQNISSGIIHLENAGDSFLNVKLQSSVPWLNCEPNQIQIINHEVIPVSLQLDKKSVREGQEKAVVEFVTNGGAQQVEFRPDKYFTFIRALKHEAIFTLTSNLKIYFARIPGGLYIGGSTLQSDPDTNFRIEIPQQEFQLDEFWIGTSPVTNSQYRLYILESGNTCPINWENGQIPEGREYCPVSYVSWKDASGFCTWLGERIGLDVSLPSELEWEKAARGVDGRKYPWGNQEPDRDKCNFNSTDTITVGICSPMGDSPFGCMDMSGNVQEWTRSLFKYREFVPDNNSAEEIAQSRVLKGGSWFSNSIELRCAWRSRSTENLTRNDIGFRCMYKNQVSSL